MSNLISMRNNFNKLPKSLTNKVSQHHATAIRKSSFETTAPQIRMSPHPSPPSQTKRPTQNQNQNQTNRNKQMLKSTTRR